MSMDDFAPSAVYSFPAIYLGPLAQAVTFRDLWRLSLEVHPATSIIPKMSEILKDSYNRAIRDLRVSLTDRCNFRCFYCLPHGEPPIAPKEQMLSYEEIEYVCDIFVEFGIEKIRLTGGEPMMRRDIEADHLQTSATERSRPARSGAHN